jgi:hypothetical protein
MKSKSSQQEIIGFSVIVLMVIIVAVILLGIYLRKGGEINREDSEIENFLISSARYTTLCYKDYETDYRTLGQVVESCYENSRITCPEGKNACAFAKENYGWMLEKLWPSGEERPTKYTKMQFFYYENLSDDDTRREFTDSLMKGNLTGCESLRAGRNFIYVSEGAIILELDVCKGD